MEDWVFEDVVWWIMELPYGEGRWVCTMETKMPYGWGNSLYSVLAGRMAISVW